MKHLYIKKNTIEHICDILNSMNRDELCELVSSMSEKTFYQLGSILTSTYKSQGDIK